LHQKEALVRWLLDTSSKGSGRARDALVFASQLHYGSVRAHEAGTLSETKLFAAEELLASAVALAK
jgi:hypothetical protein